MICICYYWGTHAYLIVVGGYTIQRSNRSRKQMRILTTKKFCWTHILKFALACIRIRSLISSLWKRWANFQVCGGIERNHRRIKDYGCNWIKLQITRRLHRKLIGIKDVFMFNSLLLMRVMQYFRRLNKITTILQDIKNSNLFKFRYFLSFFLVCHTDTFFLNGIILDCGNCFCWCWCCLFNFMCNESLHCNSMSYQVIYIYLYIYCSL